MSQIYQYVLTDCRWQESTLADVSGVSKTVWPVKISESLFLPEFKLSCDIEESNIQVSFFCRPIDQADRGVI